MVYNEITEKYLTGSEFSNGAIVSLESTGSKLQRRDDYLIEIVKNKNVLHLGFVDHLPLIDEKIRQNNWLHKKLMDSSNICYGIDINNEGITYIQEKYEYEHLYVSNILTDDICNDILDVQFDYLLIPDVIEHIGNPVEFLEAIKKKFQNNVDKVILTTPNGFRLNNFLNVFRNIEIINTDHRFWFTPYTLSKIVIDAKCNINNIGYFEHGYLSRRQIFRKMILSKYYGFRDTLIMEINLK